MFYGSFKCSCVILKIYRDILFYFPEYHLCVHVFIILLFYIFLAKNLAFDCVDSQFLLCFIPFYSFSFNSFLLAFFILTFFTQLLELNALVTSFQYIPSSKYTFNSLKCAYKNCFLCPTNFDVINLLSF
jgi:hypothetical protein